MARPPKPLSADLPVPLLTPSEAARLLGVSTRQLRSITQHGNIPYVDVGLGERETRRYRVADLEAFIAERTRCPRPPVPATPTATLSTVASEFRARVLARQQAIGTGRKGPRG